MDLGSFSLIATGLIILDTGKEPINLGVNFFMFGPQWNISGQKSNSLPQLVGRPLGVTAVGHSLAVRGGPEQSLPCFSPVR